MKVSQISNNNSQSFGALRFNDGVGKIIKTRVGNDAKSFEMLDKLIEQASKNKKVNIDLTATPDAKTPSAKLHTTSDTIRYFETEKESFFSRHFQGGVLGFLKRCINKAEIDAEKITQAEHVRNFDYIDSIRKDLR